MEVGTEADRDGGRYRALRVYFRGPWPPVYKSHSNYGRFEKPLSPIPPTLPSTPLVETTFVNQNDRWLQENFYQNQSKQADAVSHQRIAGLEYVNGGEGTVMEESGDQRHGNDGQSQNDNGNGYGNGNDGNGGNGNGQSDGNGSNGYGDGGGLFDPFGLW